MDFISKYMFDRCPHVFDNNRENFVSWKNELANNIEVDPASLTLIGSSSVGISLNPYKNYKLFDEKSDIDVAVISPYHFQTAWRYFRNNGSFRFKLSGKQRASWDEHVSGKIFWGTIATDSLLPIMPFGAKWIAALSQASLSPLVGSRQVNIRLYNDYESLRSYQVSGTKRLQTQLIASGVE